MRTRALCPFCTTDIEPTEIILCRSCSTPHHSQCWKENGLCTMYGCDSDDAIELVFRDPNLSDSEDDEESSTTRQISRQLGWCESCGYSFLSGSHTRCTMCGAGFHPSCWKEGMNCPSCSLGQPILPPTDDQRIVFKCGVCSEDITKGGVRMCTICGTTHHDKCWPPARNCPNCGIGRPTE